MTIDPSFARRLKRLIAVSAVALGLIFLLAYNTSGAGWISYGLLIGGWVSMPILLARSLERPMWRYLLAIPAGLVSSGLVIVAFGFDGSSVAQIGWWSMTAGVLLGGTLGGWFWYRWMPVPRILDQPFSTGRWALIAVHAGLIVAGGALVLFGELL
jgi:hypothetical protein